jgi:hypothetical protein
MAVQVNVFGRQLGEDFLISPEERIQNILYAQENQTPFTQPDEELSKIDRQNQSRWANEQTAPLFLNTTQNISGGVANPGRIENEAFNTANSQSLAKVKNVAAASRREKQQWESMQASSISRQILGQNEEFTPEVQEWIDTQTQLTGINPILNLTEEQIEAAKQTGVISVPGGIQHLTAEEQLAGRSSGMPIKRGDLARFYSPDNDVEDIVGQAESNIPSTMPVGRGGISAKPATNRDGNLGAWTTMDRMAVIDNVTWLREVRGKVETAISSMAVDKEGNTTEFGRLLDKEFGVGSAFNPSVAGIVTTAYYSALNESRYAEYSKEDEQRHGKYRDDNDGMNDPDIWETSEDGKQAETPKLRVLTEAIGKSMEEVGTFKFSSPEIRDFLGDAVRKTFTNLGAGVSLTTPTIDWMGADTGKQFQQFSIEEVEAGEASEFSPVNGISFEGTIGKQRLGDIIGIINALQPGKRKNARFSPPPLIPLNRRDPKSASAIKGVSSVRNSYLNIIQAMGNKLDPYVTNLLASLIYKGPEWNHIVSKILKIEETGVNIMLQQSADVANNGGIFYQQYKQQNSARHAAEELAGMQNLNGQRIATIPPTPELIALSSETNPDKYSKAEADFVAAAMAQLGYNKWGDNLQGNDNLRYSAILRRFKQLLDPKHPMRIFQEKMLAYEKTLRVQKGATPEEFGIDWTDGMEFLTDKDSLQAMWSLNEFLKAKEAGSKEFLDPYVTGLDSMQNGLFGIGVLMGDIASTQSGGARTKGSSSDFFKDETGLLENDKTYMTTLGMARSFFLNKVQEDPQLLKFAELFFMNSDPKKELGNLFQKEFAKKVVVGGQYGEMEKSSARSMTIGFLEWLERVDNSVNRGNVRDDVMADINEMYGVGGADVNYYFRKASARNIEDPVPVMYFKVQMQGKKKTATDKIVIEGDARKQMAAIAKIFNMAMKKAAPVIADYTGKMRDIYTAMVELAGYSQDWNLDLINGIELQIKEPDVTDPNKPIYNKNGYANDWGNGIRLNLLDSIVENKWISVPLQGWIINNETDSIDDTAWKERKAWLRTPSRSYNADLTQERAALDYNSPIRPRSAGLTRFPVVSLHALDDLAMAITVHELKRKYKDEFDWFNSIWDEGKVRKQFRERFADEYNKAWMAVLIENNYFKQMSAAFSTAMRNIPPEHLAMINGDKRAQETLQIVRDLVSDLVRSADEILTGNHERGNVHKVRVNYDEHSTQNMPANTRDREGHLTKKNGQTVPQPRTYEKQNRDDKNRFAKSAIAGLHPGMFSTATVKEKMEWQALNSKRKKK